MLEDVLKDWSGMEVSAMEVYTDIFKLGTGQIQKEGQDEETRNLKSNPVAYWKNDKDLKGHYRILFDDTFPEILKELQEADFSILNGITYFGRKNLQANANRMYALIFDLDGVTDETLNNFLSGAFRAKVYPVPNYVMLSGHGIHLYYLFEEPVSLYPYLKIQLKTLKYALTEKMWNPYTSKDDKKQFQGINQGFRVVGGKTKIEGVRIRAFRMNSHPFSLGMLSEYVPENQRVEEYKFHRESLITLEDAKKRYPEWYEKRIVNGDKTKGHWTCKPDLYEWWKRQIRAGAALHHRYFNIMCLAIYAVKSGIEEDQLKQDAYGLIPFLNDIAPSEPFIKADVESALECYDERYVTFPIEDISKLSGIEIKKNKRNRRPQKIHLQRARAVQMIDYPDGEWRNKNGRPGKADIVHEWRAAHPDGRKADCIKDTSLSKSTVYRYWE